MSGRPAGLPQIPSLLRTRGDSILHPLPPALQRSLPFLAIAIIAAHFGLVLVTCFQPLVEVPGLSAVARRYVYPVFTQYWQMFAPEPPLGGRNVLYRCRFDDDTVSDWVNPGTANLRKHQGNRFWNYGKLFNIYESIRRELDYADINLNFALDQAGLEGSQRAASMEKSMRATEQYQMVCRYLADQAGRQFPGRSIRDIEFVYMVETLPGIKDKSGAITHRVVNFPVFHLENRQ